MKRNACIKAVLRQPFRSLLMLLLIGAITYGITSHALEYRVVLNTTKQLEKYYRPIGKLESENYDVTSGRKLVSKSPYVGFEDIERCCSGVLQGLYNTDIDSYFGRGQGLDNYISDVVFYGVLQDKKYVDNNGGEYQFIFKVNKVEAGYPDYLKEGNPIYVSYKPEAIDDLKGEFDAIQIGEQYLVRAYYSEDMQNSKNSPGQILSGKAGQWFLLDKLMNDAMYFYHINKGGTVDYSDKKLSGLKEFLEVLNENQRSMMVVGTKDMSLMPDVQESTKRYYLVNGRWLNREDDLSKKKVCVVSSFFAQGRGLSVGDKITLKLRDMDGRSFGYILPMSTEDWINWRSYETKDVEFEIAGIYDEVIPSGQILMTFSTNELFIPDSCMPDNFVQGMQEVTYSAFYSFVLKSAENQKAFLAENRSSLENMGISVSFVDNNADNFGVSSSELKSSTQKSFWIFSCTFLPALILIVLVYLNQHYRELAIARALGISSKTAIYQVIEAAILIGLPGIVTGGIIAWYRTLAKTKNLLKDFKAPTGTEHNILLPVFLLLLFLLFLLFLMFILIGAIYMSNRPVLVLLKGQTGRREGNRSDKKNISQVVPVGNKDKKTDEISLTTHTDIKPILINIEKRKKSIVYGVITSVRYIYHHIFRSYAKALLMIIITLGFITTFGWLYHSIQQNKAEVERLYNSTVINGEISKNSLVDYSKGGGCIDPLVVDKLKSSGFIKESYLEETALATVLSDMDFNEKPNQIVASTKSAVLSFSDWEQFSIGTGKGITMKFMQGYDEKSFMQSESGVPEVIISEINMMELKKHTGDYIYIKSGDKNINCRIIGSYQGDFPSGIMKNPIIMSEYNMNKLMGKNINFLTAKFVFDPSRNKELLQKEKELENMVSIAKNEAIGLRLLIWDDELHQVIEPMERNISLLKIIYPVAVVVFSLISAVLNFIIILLRTKEAAIIRVLGNSKFKVRILFISEQIVICLIGMIAGIGLIVILQGGISISIQINFVLYGIVSIIASILGSAFVTNKTPLELLQVKE